MSSNPNGSPESAMWQLLAQSRLSEAEVCDRISKALSPTYWQQLNPELAVGSEHRIPESQPIDTPFQTDLLNRFTDQGYFQAPPLLSSLDIAQMQNCISVLRAASWPPVFAFVYDLFWLIWRSPSLVKLFSEILGADYRQTWHIWTHYVPARDGAHL